MMFGEKYGAHVRMVEMGPDSLELCGTHVAATSDIAYFRVTSEQPSPRASVASRR